MVVRGGRDVAENPGPGFQQGREKGKVDSGRSGVEAVKGVLDRRRV
jgi:hypothetical protein